MEIRRIVDLSHTLDGATQIYPGDPAPNLTPAMTIAESGFNVLAVQMGSQTGTHVDAPFHVLPNGVRIDAMDLSLFAGAGVIVDVSSLPPRAAIGRDMLAHALPQLRPGAIALLRTGWDQHWQAPGYFGHPYLSEAGCRLLLDAGVKTIGIDAPNLDETPPDFLTGNWSCHQLIARAGGVIIENLNRLGSVDFADPFISVLPLKLGGADGAPVRAVAIQLAP